MTESFNKLVGKRIADRYCITGTIGRGGMGVVFRAIPFDDPSHEVAIKVIQRSRKLGSEDLLRFQKEAALMSQLHHPNIICFHELGLFDYDESGALGSGYYIVMEIANGANLKDSLARDGRKDLAFFFQVGLQVSQALDYTHGKNIIHRDIKPHNIVVGKAFRDQRGVFVKVLDFGVASLVEVLNFGGKDGNTRRGFEDFAGTPLYMAPELTALMDAPVDHRTDLYSLGCVLYEILAGRPPFAANSREKLEKAHVFATPESLTNLRPDVPPIVEQIVHKLLAKHPSDRYQTAFGLHADLMRAKGMFELNARRTGVFPLGLKDRFQAVSAQLALTGREKAMTELVEGYESVATQKGRSRLTLLRGLPGVGKTRLMAEFRAYLAKRKIKFISGTFSQHENTLPFNALANAFNEYLLRVLKNQAHEAEELRRKFRTLLGPLAHQIADVVPGLKPFLADVPEGEADFQVEEENFSTFAKAFSDFTRCLAPDSQPLVFLFDDIHWADDKSLELIDQFFSNANTQKFYMIVSQRVGPHPHSVRFQQFIEKFGKLKRRFQEIDISSVDRAAITLITGNMLASQESVTEPLVDYLEQTSHGNPMHLVELVRTLVASDYISPRRDSDLWDYDVEAIRKANVPLNTVDLVLSRIQDYQQFDRQVLEIAATIGLTFQFEMLLLYGKTQSVPTMRALQRAIDDGLITRINDEPELRHLGKTFVFTHKKARDAIHENIQMERRRELHRLIAEKLEASLPSPTEKNLFALAHHFNFAAAGDIKSDRRLAELCLKYNLAAGRAAWTSSSWQSAEKYFENSLMLMDAWPGEISRPDERVRVQETLADLAAIQRRHGVALKKYRELLNANLPLESHGAIANKTIYFQLVSGIIGDSYRMIRETLRSVGRPLPTTGIIDLFKFYGSFILDILPFDKRSTRLHKILKRAYTLKGSDFEALERGAPAIKLFQSGATLLMHENPLLGLIYHDRALQEAAHGRGAPSTLIRVVAERAALLGYYGFTRVAYRIFDLSMDVARSLGLRPVYGYVALLRVLTLDYLKARHDEISDNLKEAMSYLPPDDDRLAYGLGLVFKIFRELQRCNFTALYQYCHRMPETVPTRNWLSPRTIAMMLYGYLLQGSRDGIVRHGEQFLKRRQQVAGRTDDLFVKVINTLIAFARGEIDKTRQAYTTTMEAFVVGQSREFLFPFEEDFIGIFAFTFPQLFEQEYGRHLMRETEMSALLLKLKRRVRAIKGQTRTVPMLLTARVTELLGGDNVRATYDATLRSAKVAGNNLSQCLAYLWFGTHLIDQGHNHRKDYIRRAYLLAQKLQLKAIVEYTEKLMEQRHITFKEATLADPQREDKLGRIGHLQSRLTVEHLSHVCESIEGRGSVEEAVKSSFALLKDYYQSGKVYCILTTNAERQPRLIYPETVGGDLQVIYDYISPYLNIRSTLFLPLSDAPWIKTEQPAGVEVAPDLGRRELKAELQDMLHNTVDGSEGDEGGSPFGDQTIVIESANPSRSFEAALGTPGKAEGALTIANSSANVLKGSMRGLQISALIPLRSESGTLGVIFIEDVGDLANRDTTVSRHELDLFGAQLGVLIQRKMALDLPAPPVSEEFATSEPPLVQFNYKPASFNLEPASWIRLWHHGQLRTQRESGWYLGLVFGPEHYVVVYCLASGPDATRERVSSMIWHHVLVSRAMAVASGRRDVELNEIRDDLAGLLAALNKSLPMDSISLAFTVFNRETKVASSGHFGPSRPFVVGAENLVTPFNEVIIHMASGRDLRYWEVTAHLHGDHTYLLSYDTSKLDGTAGETQQRQVLGNLAGASDADLHRMLESVVMADNLPRYYVAAIVEPAASIATLPKLDKAQ